MTSRSNSGRLNVALELISRTLPGGRQRASVDFRKGLIAICNRDTRALFQAVASEAKCARPKSTTRLVDGLEAESKRMFPQLDVRNDSSRKPPSRMKVSCYQDASRTGDPGPP